MQQERLDLDQYVVLEIDGPGVSPKTVDAPALLEFAAAFFQLLKANADETAEPLSLTHVQVIDKCAAVIVMPDNLELARACADEAVRQVAGSDPPKGAKELVGRVHSALRQLPSEQRARVLIGSWLRHIVTELAATADPLDSILAIRATPIRVGGSRPAVRFRSHLERDFTLDTTREIARSIGAHLYREVEIEATVRRDADGSIGSGRLRSFEPVATGDPRPAWQEWFRSVAGDDLDDKERFGT